ncbi:uncharacterized protein LOC134531469 [Bacillus rossius redtenbacheri]|uniref:uncharacterized protein LOC134531469 n=1 Tax=Bacillus rossius redtenbacheri TaxID=93214 RepID=UPI002FDE5D0D
MRRILRVCAFVIIDVLFAELCTCMPTPQFYSGSPVVELPGAAIAGRASPRASGGAGMVYVLVGLVSLPLLVTVLWLLRQLWRMLASCAGRGCPASRPDHGLEEVVIIPADHQLHCSVAQGVPSSSSALLCDGPLASSQQQHQFSPVSLMEEMLLASTREQMQSASTPGDTQLVTCHQSPSRHTVKTEAEATCDQDQEVLSPPMQDLEAFSIPDAYTQYTQELGVSIIITIIITRIKPMAR